MKRDRQDLGARTWAKRRSGAGSCGARNRRKAITAVRLVVKADGPWPENLHLASKPSPIVHVPQRLEDWTLDDVKRLAADASSENRDFEFKSAAVLKDPGGAGTISKQVSAFANARGGFLILGVTDRPPRRLEGVEVSSELAKHLNDRIQVEPHVEYPTPRLLEAENGRHIIVLHIPEGREGPYASIVDGIPRFYVRTHSGAEPMNWVQIRDAMVRADERRQHGDMLLVQLRHYYKIAYRLGGLARRRPAYPEPAWFDLTLTHTSLAALTPFLDEQAMESFAELLEKLQFINGQLDVMVAAVAGRDQQLVKWHQRLEGEARHVIEPLKHADAALRRVLGLSAATRDMYRDF